MAEEYLYLKAMDKFHFNISPEVERRKRLENTKDLYYRVVRYIMSIYEIPNLRVRETIINVARKNRVDSENYEFCIAYMLYHFPSYTELAFIHMSGFLEDSAAQLTIPDKKLNIVSIGDGPGHDLLGFISTICEKRLSVEKMEVTLVDMLIGWKIFSSALLWDIKKIDNRTPLSEYWNKIDFSSNFIQAEFGNCDQETSQNICRKITEADLVIIFRVFEAVDEQKKKAIIEDLAVSMKDESLLYISEVKELVMPESKILQENFKTVYSSYRNARIDFPAEDRLFPRENWTCKQSCSGYAVILKKEKIKSSQETDCEDCQGSSQ